jgi:hypothetical protein
VSRPEPRGGPPGWFSGCLSEVLWILAWFTALLAALVSWTYFDQRLTRIEEHMGLKPCAVNFATKEVVRCP